MLTIAYYFLQVVLCSSIMMGYYWLVLRNKRFHQYNRFYLLGVALLSCCIPLIKINVAKPVEEAPAQLINLVNIVADSNSEIEQIVVQKGFAINWDMVVISLYACVSAIFLFSMIVALVRIYALLKKYSCKSLGDVYLIMTNNVKGTPFSFFKYIFWNDAVDIQTPTGQQMMQHELAHVREKHSIDKLFMQVVMMFGWFNPFFWLLKKELNLIHEFIADNKAIKNGDAAELAAMLLTAAYPNQQYLLTNPFFFSPIKRRILMLTKTNNPRLSYARRVVVLPLLAVTVMLFAFRKKEAIKNIAPLNKVYTVVIDAGHGGKDLGATAADGTTEKDLALVMLKAMKNVNTNDKIKLVFTREEDVYQTPIEKANFVNEQKADLFISLHVNWDVTGKELKNGLEITIPNKQFTKEMLEKSNSLARYLSVPLFKGYTGNHRIHETQKGIWVLSNSACPSILIECGYMNNKKDLALLKDENERNKMAKLILEGIENYLANDNVVTVANTKLEKGTGDSLTLIELATYEKMVKSCIKTYTMKNGKNAMIIDAGKAPIDELNTYYDRMNDRQRATCTKLLGIVPKMAVPTKKSPTTEELKSWEDAKMYGVWLDGKRISNIELSKYKPADFSLYYVSKLGKNTVNYGKHYYQVDLMTLTYFKKSYEDNKRYKLQVRSAEDSIRKVVERRNKNNASILNPQISKFPPKAGYRIFAADTLFVENSKKARNNMANALIIVDGERLSWEDAINKIPTGRFASVKYLKDDASIAPYGEAGKNGVIIIITKKQKAPITMLSPLNNGYVKEKFGKSVVLKRARYLDSTNDISWSRRIDILLSFLKNANLQKDIIPSTLPIKDAIIDDLVSRRNEIIVMNGKHPSQTNMVSFNSLNFLNKKIMQRLENLKAVKIF